ncbi:PEP-CTERM sorting domain-containing protein [Thalassomonas haliotis]|uniref:PEP-CTERM sorting domain-containing protein n=1 Tax=Thalassomonas haliotis TaxID=485448 RepID=A0ABY7VFV8_9GAMM|nr:PEP-CTERM sorting domain-containing protein [Thalassomonas haliotis]WDE12054.1 PEP-CTERM sorting domain-containing protein [Thalassomonas haliotis]
MKKLFALVAVLGLSSQVNATPIDLSNWTETPGGDWTLAADGSSVFQSTNGQPTYFLSENTYINTEFNGTFGVETSSDDDYIGFVFGYNNSDDYLLFDWKQGEQSSAYSGFTLSQISGSNVDLWRHSGSDLTVLASDYTTRDSFKGWLDNTSYNFTLDFTSSGIRIDIDGSTIFDVDGSFSDGKFGFYNYSQSQVRYSGFEETVSETVPEPSTLAIFALGIMGLAVRRFRK